MIELNTFLFENVKTQKADPNDMKKSGFLMFGGDYRTRWPLCHRQSVWLPPVFELVAARCHWLLAFRWVRVP